MAYLVHHTLNRNGIYTGGNPKPTNDEKSLTDKSQCKKNLETNKKSTFFFSHSKSMEESVILNVNTRDKFKLFIKACHLLALILVQSIFFLFLDLYHSLAHC